MGNRHLCSQYRVDIEFSTPCLESRQTFIVKTLSDIARLKELQAKHNFKVVGFRLQHLMTVEDVVAAIAEERQERKAFA